MSRQRIETYGDPHLHPGYYPISSTYDNGGCNATYPEYIKPLLEGYGDVHLHNSCYPQERMRTMCNRGDIRASCGEGCISCVPSLQDRDIKETYGDPHLHPGIYEDHTVYNENGCMYEPRVGDASCDDHARADERQRLMEQRAGNNPYVYEEIPMYAKTGYTTGTGCMNPDCECLNCQGMCMCGANDGMVMSLFNKIHSTFMMFVPSFTSNHLLNMILTIMIVYFVYKKLLKKL